VAHLGTAHDDYEFLRLAQYSLDGVEVTEVKGLEAPDK
jgi:hypothetical protein